MGTTAQKLQAIANSKAAIKSAIEAKGVSDVGDVLADYATKIGQISGGGGSTKFGMTIDNVFGDVNPSGQLQFPSTSFSFASNDIVSIPAYGLYYKFYNNTGITSVSLPNLSSLATGNYTMGYAFYGCTNLTSVNLPKLASGTLNTTFRGCTSLTSVELPEFNGSLPSTFIGCSNLVSFSAPKMTTGSMTSPFINCTKLQTVDLSGLTTTYLSSTFSGCTALRTVKLYNYRGTLSTTFQNCANLEWVDFHLTTSVPTLSNTTTFSGTNNTYRIIVPNALYNDWISASNWSYSSIVTHIEKFLKVVGFKAESANSTISLDAVGTPPSLDLEYTTDGGETYAPYTVGTTITLTSVGDEVYFRAGTTGQSALATDSSNYHKFTMSGQISCASTRIDLSYLLSRSAISESTQLSDYAFYGLFNGCSALQNAPELPWTSLGTGCYGSMFKGCTSITTAPELPATTLATGCYNEMFYNCSALNEITIGYTGNFSTTYFNDWMNGVAAKGLIYYEGSDRTTGASAIPTGWMVDADLYKGLSFIAKQAGSTVKMVAESGAPSVSLQYSLDEGSTWNAFTVGTTTVTLPNVGDRVCFKATTTNAKMSNSYDSQYNHFVMTGKFDASGNINSLLNQNFASVTAIPQNCYVRLFTGNTSLVDASKMTLYATTTGNNAWGHMF